MYYYLLKAELEADVITFTRRHCTRRDGFIRRNENGQVVVRFTNEDRAHLFLNLFDDEIDRSFAVALTPTIEAA